MTSDIVIAWADWSPVQSWAIIGLVSFGYWLWVKLVGRMIVALSRVV